MLLPRTRDQTTRHNSRSNGKETHLNVIRREQSTRVFSLFRNATGVSDSGFSSGAVVPLEAGTSPSKVRLRGGSASTTGRGATAACCGCLRFLAMIVCLGLPSLDIPPPPPPSLCQSVGHLWGFSKLSVNANRVASSPRARGSSARAGRGFRV